MSAYSVGQLAETSPPESTASSRRYLFAVVYAGTGYCASPGMDGEGVSTIVEGRLAAVVSGVCGTRIRPERRCLATHQDVLKQLLTTTTPLPMSFGILADSPAAVRGILKRNQSMFLEQLDLVADKIEMGLRVSLDVPNIFEYVVDTRPELRMARDRLQGGTRVPTQDEKIELGRLFDRLLNETRENCGEQVQRILLSSCSEIKANKCRNENEVMNLACLVPRRDVEKFDNSIFQAARIFDDNFRFDYNGPWAPHNFVDISLEP